MYSRNNANPILLLYIFQSFTVFYCCYIDDFPIHIFVVNKLKLQYNPKDSSPT